MAARYTDLEMEAALCVWECLCEWTLGGDISPGAPLYRPDWSKLREKLGSAEMRSQSVVVGKWCLEIYDFLKKSDKDIFEWLAYDWEVIPAMLNHAVDAKHGKPTVYREDYVYIGGPLMAPERAAQLVAHELHERQFIADCREQARKQWCYSGLVTDFSDRVRQAFESGEEPVEFIKWLGEKYELIPANSW